MFAVIFETTPNAAEIGQYLEIAAMLRPELEQIDGFLENERFQRSGAPGALLSLSLWRDEKALIRWRTRQLHHRSQERGRAGVLSDYRLRVAQVVAQWPQTGLFQTEAIRDDLTANETGRHVTISIGQKPMPPVPAAMVTGVLHFEALNASGKNLLLIDWRAPAAAIDWLRAQQGVQAQGARHLALNVIRSYGMRDRGEAPVFHAPLAGATQ